MPLMRRRCDKCQEMYSPHRHDSKHCSKCTRKREPSQMQREISRLKELVSSLERQSDVAWRNWLTKQLEPMLGDERLNEVIYKLLGREKVEA